MSCIFKTQGGAAAPSASIFVTGPAQGDNVFATQRVLNPAGHGLPDGYTELSYIESTGTQYVDTGIKASSNVDVEIDYMDYVPLGSENVLFGGGAEDWPKQLGLNNSVTQKQTLAYYNYDGFTGYAIQGNCKFKLASGVLYANDVQVYSNTFSTFSYNHSIYLFAQSWAGAAQFYSKFKLRSFKMWESSALVRDFIPAKRNSDGAVGLYDLVNGVFYTNAGTGSFIAGEEIPTYIPGAVKQGVWAQKRNTAIRLPDAYTELEYIESTGTQYIDTLYKLVGETKVRYKYSLTDAAGDIKMFGEWAGTKAEYHFSGSINQKFYFWNYEDFASQTACVANETYDVEAFWGNANYYYKVNGSNVVSGSKAGTFTGIYNAFVFAGNHQNSPISFTKAKLYSFEIEDTSGVVRNFIPAKRKSDSAIGMYDLVSNAFFENAGTGSFIAGAEIPTYTYGHRISDLALSYMWTVTATDGSKTKTQDVLVDAAVEYDIELSLGKLWLYREGDECEEVTGGWSIVKSDNWDVSPILTKETTRLRIQCPYWCAGYLITDNNVDATGYSKLWVDYSVDGIDSTSTGFVFPTQITPEGAEINIVSGSIILPSPASANIVEEYNGTVWLKAGNTGAGYIYINNMWLE